MQTSTSTTAHGLRFSMPGLLLRAEGLALGAAALVLYGHLGYSWVTFAVFILAPDLAFLFALVNPATGSVAYNVAHFPGLPALIGLVGVLAASPVAIQIALIWFAHIALDRVVGYGFKYLGQFKETHLQRV